MDGRRDKFIIEFIIIIIIIITDGWMRGRKSKLCTGDIWWDKIVKDRT